MRACVPGKQDYDMKNKIFVIGRPIRKATLLHCKSILPEMECFSNKVMDAGDCK